MNLPDTPIAIPLADTPDLVVYEHQAKCKNLAITQMVMYALSMVVMYHYFYFPIVGFATGLVGVFSTRSPMTHHQVKYVSVFYYLNFFMIGFISLFAAFWLLLAFWVSWQDEYAMEVWVIGSGLVLLIIIIGITCVTIRAARVLRHELMRNPPKYTLKAMAV